MRHRDHHHHHHHHHQEEDHEHDLSNRRTRVKVHDSENYVVMMHDRDNLVKKSTNNSRIVYGGIASVIGVGMIYFLKPKVSLYSYSLWNNVTSTDNISRLSEKYKLSATPSADTFLIWGTIYRRLSRYTLVTPLVDKDFNESMSLSVEWLTKWNDEDLIGARDTIAKLKDVNIKMVTRYMNCKNPANDSYHLKTLDMYATWVCLASLLNNWVVKVYVDNQKDESLDDMKKILNTITATRPGVIFAIDNYIDGVDLLKKKT